MSTLRISLFAIAAAGWLSAWLAGSACAKPEYARKEGVACQYCHLNGSPGTLDQFTGKRQSTDCNPRGIYYGAHNHSFQGYSEAAKTSKVAAPNFHFVWKEEFKTLPRRAAVADVTGDGKSRLILLNEKPGDKNASTLEIKRWDGKAFVTEFTGNVSAPADRLAVGKIGGSDRPAVILTSDALWVWDGTTFARRPAAAPLPILGVTRMLDGTERVLVAQSSLDVKAYKVNLTSVKKDDWLVDPIKAPSPPQDVWGDMHATPEFLTSMGLPDALGAGGIVGIWNIQKFNAYFIYHMDRDSDIGPDPQNPGKPKVTYNNVYYVTFRDSRTGEKLWTSPKLPGEGYDILLDDPKGSGKPGFLVLFNGTTPVTGATPGKGRTIAYFAMD
jgi:hypothetical protein